MTLKEKRIFFNWLKKHNALERYKRNRFVFIHEYKRYGWRRFYNYTSLSINSALGFAFSWMETPEGYTYWRNLDTLWSEEYYRIMRRIS